jgi:transcriptional regulator with XRE-family HTH domain
MKQPELGKKIMELRLARGLTQGELAQKCNLSLRTIQRIEAAEVTPRCYTVKLIFQCLDYQIYDSFGKFSYRLDRLAYRMRTGLGQFCN